VGVGARRPLTSLNVDPVESVDRIWARIRHTSYWSSRRRRRVCGHAATVAGCQLTGETPSAGRSGKILFS
jgi:hypothetical protein